MFSVDRGNYRCLPINLDLFMNIFILFGKIFLFLTNIPN
jgi:hypothetical protein